MKNSAFALRLTLLCLLFNAVLVVMSVGYSYGWSTFDTMTKSLVCDAAFNYFKYGLFHNAGLPMISDAWIRGAYPDAVVVPNVEHVYLHYPSVVYFLGGVGAKLFSVDDIRYLRIIPMAVNSSLLFVFFCGVFSVLTDPVRRRWFVICFAAIPMGWAQLNGFSPNIYAHYIMLALVGVLLPLFHAARPELSRYYCAAAGCLGFLAGCFTWDYVFVMSLAPLAVASLYHGEDVFRKGPLRTLTFWLCVCVGAGFTVAQGLHFLQVVSYYGSLEATLRDFGNALYFRATNVTSQYHFLTGLLATHKECNEYCQHIAGLGPIMGRLTLIADYLFKFTSVDTKDGIVLILPVGVWLLLAAMFVWALGDRALKRRFVTMACILVTTCFLWMMILLNHGSVHTHILPRHFYLIYMLLVFFMIENFQRLTDRKRPDRSGIKAAG